MKRVYTRSELQERTAKVEALQDLKNPLRIYQEAAQNGMNVSSYLEELDPSDDTDSLDAFERHIAAAGIRTRGIASKAVYASKVENFYASNQPVSQFLFPEFLNRTVREARTETDNLDALIAVRTPIDSNVYKTIYLDTDQIAETRMHRVAEMAEIPTVQLKTREQSISLTKRGIAIEASYETIRRMQIDKLALHLKQVALQNGIDKKSEILSAIINGTGNGDAAATMTAASLDAAATSGITYKAWLKFLTKFNPYTCRTVVGNMDSIVALLTMAFPQGDPMMMIAQQSGDNSGLKMTLPGDIFTNLTLVLAPGAPANTLVGTDREFAVEEVSEIGATLTETDKIIKQQFDVIAMTETLGYGIIEDNANKVLTFV